jgi:hypothetical protein
MEIGLDILHNRSQPEFHFQEQVAGKMMQRRNFHLERYMLEHIHVRVNIAWWRVEYHKGKIASYTILLVQRPRMKKFDARHIQHSFHNIHPFPNNCYRPSLYIYYTCAMRDTVKIMVSRQFF